MSDLVPVTQSIINGETVPTVSARELHVFLEVGKDFSTWIKERIAQYGFIENQDFVVFTEIGENPLGGRPAKEYAITLDMAKELSMVERNEKGKQARQYFIECEKKLKEYSQPALPTIHDPSIEASIKALIIADQAKHQAAIAEAKADSALQRLDQIETGIDHFTIIGYARTFLKKSLPLKDAAIFGKVATRLCNDMGIAMGTVPDPRFGQVNTYPKSVLDEVCH
jgi:anti-repressor protein